MKASEEGVAVTVTTVLPLHAAMAVKPTARAAFKSL
jgi:hypothetical protein